MICTDGTWPHDGSTYDGLTYDFSALLWWGSNTHPAETVRSLWISSFSRLLTCGAGLHHGVGRCGSQSPTWSRDWRTELSVALNAADTSSVCVFCPSQTWPEEVPSSCCRQMTGGPFQPPQRRFTILQVIWCYFSKNVTSYN